MKIAKIINTDKVSIQRHDGAVILESIANDWAWLERVTGPLDDDFVEAATEQPGEQKRYDADDPLPLEGRDRGWG